MCVSLSLSLSLSLSPRVEKLKVKKKANKRFVPEPRESSTVLQDSYVYERFTYPVCFTYRYHGCVTQSSFPFRHLFGYISFLQGQSFGDEREFYYYKGFSHKRLSLSDSTSPPVSSTFLSILADLNNAVVWIVTARPLISKSPSDCSECTNYSWCYGHLHVPHIFLLL